MRRTYSNSGLTALELAVIPLLLALTLSLLKSGLRKTTAILALVENQEERDDIKHYLVKNFSCEETVARAKHICERGGFIPTYTNRCSPLTRGGPVGNRVFKDYQLRTFCSRKSDQFEIRFEISHLAPTHWVPLEMPKQVCAIERSYRLAESTSKRLIRLGLLGSDELKRRPTPNQICHALGFDFGKFQTQGTPTRFAKRDVICETKHFKRCR